MADARSNTPRTWNSEDDLRELAAEGGPFVTMHMATPAQQENASQDSILRWRSMRDEMVESGAGELAIKGLDELIGDAHLEGEGLYVIASDDGVRHVSHWPSRPVREFATRENTPVFTPLLQMRQRMIPHVCATLDRTGAVIRAYRHEGNALHRVVEGDPSDPIRKVQAGGWSQKRFEMRAEDTWEHNAKAAAAEIALAAEAVNARCVFIAGDVRAVQLAESHLPPACQALVEEVNGSRANDGSPLIDEDEVSAVLGQVLRSDSDALLAKLAEEMGQHDRAACGAQGVVDALAAGRVEVLIVGANSQTSGRPCWMGEEPTQIALSEDRVRSIGALSPRSAPLVDAAIACALRSSSGVWIVDDAERVPEGIAAILRW